jgi:hypothetical protein
MKHILNSIDNYLLIKEKDETIRAHLSSISKDHSINELIEIIKKDKTRMNEIISSLSEDKRNQIEIFIEGGII